MENIKLAVIGLGYVGLPLARLFATRYPVVGYDVKRERVAALMEGRDVGSIGRIVKVRATAPVAGGR